LWLQLDQLLQARTALNASLAGSAKLSVNDFIVKAAALACKKVPAVRGRSCAEAGVGDTLPVAGTAQQFSLRPLVMA
jgi:pyruvate/2-oxoglutarate dehydrogenase complex dihydrolipoamide acyltransferase (E2) component